MFRMQIRNWLISVFAHTNVEVLELLKYIKRTFCSIRQMREAYAIASEMICLALLATCESVWQTSQLTCQREAKKTWENYLRWISRMNCLLCNQVSQSQSSQNYFQSNREILMNDVAVDYNAFTFSFFVDENHTVFSHGVLLHHHVSSQPSHQWSQKQRRQQDRRSERTLPYPSSAHQMFKP